VSVKICFKKPRGKQPVTMQRTKRNQTKQTIAAWGMLAAIVMLIFFLGFYTHKAFAFSGRKPKQPEAPTTPTVPVPGPAISIEKIVSNHPECALYSWKNQGRAPIGYVIGVAKVFAAQVCGSTPSPGLGNSSDALSYYRVSSGNWVNTYALLLGLGMRESSGQWCEGRDMSARNVTSETAEAGLFQTSWNSRSASSELLKIFAKYKTASAAKCDLTTFKLGVSTRYCAGPRGTDYGSGDGKEFQRLSKICPAFATEYAAYGIRKIRPHWGPLSRREAEFRSACQVMFTEIEAEAKKSCQR
jgi:hypothetical protein